MLNVHPTARAYLEYGWAKTWGDPAAESYAYGAAADSSGNVYVVGYFNGANVDFDTGAGTDNHSSNGGTDAYVVKYDSDGNFLWARTWGSTASDAANGVSLDTLGNVYITGNFGGSAAENVDFDGTAGTDNHTAYGNNANLFITKYNSDGTYGWSQTLYGAANNTPLGIAVSSSGTIFATGQFNGIVDFDPTPTVENHSNISFSKMFITKYDTSGNYYWTQTLEGTGSAEGDAITVDTLGNAYVSGYYYQTIDFDPTGATDNHTYAGNGGFVTKYDTNGNYLWVKTQEGAGAGNNSNAYAIKSDSSNNIYTSGRLSGTIDYDPGAGVDNHTTNGNEDIFLQKLDSDGNYVWAKHIGGTSFERGYALSIDSSDNVYIGGFWSGTVDFDPGVGEDIKTEISDWGVAMYATAYDSSGTYLWTRITNYGQESDGYGIAAYDSGVYLVGDAYGNVDFNPEGGGDVVPGATDWGSSALVKWATAAPVTPTPSSSPLPSSSGTSTDVDTTWPSPAPSPQSAPTVTSATVDGNEVTLNFVPGVGPQTSYTVYYGTTPSADEFAATGLGDSNSTSITIGELIIGETYYFVLVPVNDSPQGPPATVFRVDIIDTSTISPPDEDGVYTIQITLYDQNNEPLVGATVTATNIDSSTPTDTDSTSSAGVVNINNLSSGTYLIKITISSGMDFERTIVVDSTSDKSITFQLNTNPSNENGENSSTLSDLTTQASSLISGLNSNFISNTIQYLQDNLTPENSVKIAEAEVTTTAIAASGYGAVSALLAIGTILKTLSLVYSESSRSIVKLPADLISSLFHWLTTSISSTFPFIAFVKRKRKKPGIVFNAISSDPVKGAYVVFFSQSGNLKSAFTDQEGRYSVQPRPDDYEIKVSHRQFNFPSQLVSQFTKTLYEKLYSPGEKINVVTENETISGIAVPLDPKDPSILQRLFSFFGNFVLFFFNIFKVPLAVAAAFITTIAILTQRSPETISAFIIVLAFWIYLIRSFVVDRAVAS